MILKLSLILYFPIANASSSIGWIEKVPVYLNDQFVTVEAKIDSGADHSSLHAMNIVYVKRNNQNWVKFDTVKGIDVELPLYKETKIKTKMNGYQTRPVVLLDICIGQIKRSIEVNLVNRNHFSKPMLVGRSALSNFLIDPTKTYLLNQDSCADYKEIY